MTSRAEEQDLAGGDAAWWRWLAGLTLLAALARVIGLDSGLWIDEIYSLVRSFRAPIGTILTEYWGDNHHPLYAVLAHGSRAAFGESAWSLRLPAAAFGVAAVPMLALLGREVASRREGLLAALLLALSYHHVWFSQNARGYSAIAFFAVAGMWLIVRAMRGGPGAARYWMAYAGVAALGAYTHLTMILVVAGHALGVALLLARTGQWSLATWGPPLVGFVGGALLTVLLYAPMLGDVVAFFGETKSNLQGVSTPSWAVLEGMRVLVLGLSGGLVAVGALVAAAGGVVGLCGLGSYWRRTPLFVLLVLCPIAVTLFGAALARGTLYPRFFFFAIGPALVVAVRGTFAVVGWVAGRVPSLGAPARPATAAIAVVALLSAAALSANYRYPKQDFAGAVRYVLVQRAAADLVVSTGVPADPYRTLYGQDWPNVTSPATLDSLRGLGRRVWVLWTFPRYIEASTPDLAQVLRAECPVSRVFRGSVGGGDVHVCALEPR